MRRRIGEIGSGLFAGGGEKREPETPSGEAGKRDERVRRLQRRLKEKDREIEDLRARMLRASSEAGGVRPENVVWMFGTGRSGSTWLSDMMEELEGHAIWREPLVGALFGDLYYVRAGRRQAEKSGHFVLGEPYKETWLGPMRSLILGGATARFPDVAEGGGYVVIKEPNGSVGAPLLVRALPESRVVFLIRDPRDVAASSLDARREGSWLYANKGADRARVANEDPDRFIKARVENYLRDVGNSREAYDAHRGPKSLVRYEDLRVDTLGAMRRVYRELGITVDDAELTRAVEAHSWEAIPEKEKGEGKFYRKGAPGSWRQDLTPEQARIVEEVTAPILEEFYP